MSERFSDPYRLYSIQDVESGKRIHRFRGRKVAEERVVELERSGSRVQLKPSRYYFVDVYHPVRGGTHRCTYARNLEAAKSVLEGWRSTARDVSEGRPKLQPLVR